MTEAQRGAETTQKGHDSQADSAVHGEGSGEPAAAPSAPYGEFTSEGGHHVKFGKGGRERYVTFRFKLPVGLLERLEASAKNDAQDTASWLRQLITRELRGELIEIPLNRRVRLILERVDDAVVQPQTTPG